MPPESIQLWLQLGVGGGFLVLLFLGLRNSIIFTRGAVDRITDQYDKRLLDKDKYIDKLESLNDKLTEHNDLLTSKISQTLEVSRAQGMIAALPPEVTERVLQ
jgi:hypothetical protein